MSEANTNSNQAANNTQTTAAAPAQTQSAAGNTDVEVMIQRAEQKAAEAAEKKMEAVFKSMLGQQGLDADAISKMTAEWKSKQKTPETITKELEEEKGRLEAENAGLREQMRVIAKGIPADKAERYIALAKTYPDADKDFDKALENALKDFPLAKTAKPDPQIITGGGAGGNPQAGSGAKGWRENLQANFIKARKE